MSTPDTTRTRRRRPVPSDVFGGRLADAFLVELRVAAVDDLAPHVRSVTFESPDLVDFVFDAGQDLMIEFPKAGGSTRRRFTIRRADARAGTVDVEFERHGDGVASGWAEAATPGQVLDAIGPRGAITLDPDALRHLFIADDSAAPAVFAMVEALAGAPAAVVVVTPHGPGSRPGPAATTSTSLWVRPEALGSALDGAHLGDGTTAYVFGERVLVLEAIESLTTRGLAPESIRSKAYWRRDQANADHGEPTKA